MFDGWHGVDGSKRLFTCQMAPDVKPFKVVIIGLVMCICLFLKKKKCFNGCKPVIVICESVSIERINC